MKSNLLENVVSNNAAWCDAVCRSHGVHGEFMPSAWMVQVKTPPFYPNLITLTKDGGPEQVALVSKLLEAGIEGEIGVKDSFSAINLAPLGFRILFESEWLIRAGDAPLPNVHDGIEWRKINESMLEQWERAWASQEPSTTKIFLPALLKDENIVFLGGFRKGIIVAGCIANKTDGIVGLSNVFSSTEEAKDVWAGCLRMVSTLFPSLPIAGYETGESLAIAKNMGFEFLGRLKIWVRG